MKLERKHQFFMALLSIGLGLLVAEAGVRLFCRTESDGNRYFGNVQLKPYHLPVERTRQLVNEYEKSLASSAINYDADLGWAPHPGMAGSNQQGFNSTAPNPEKSHQEALRVEVFGASYNRGWWKDMENTFTGSGLKAEVFDFGVGGYGLDQAYLRWKKQGVEYHPDIVVLGYCLGTIFNNANMLRLIQNPQSGLPFAKPRFVTSGTGMDLINVPTQKPGELAEFVSRLEQWPLLRYESFYHPGDYAYTPLRHLMLYALIEAKLDSFGSGSLRYLSSRKAIQPRFFKPGDESVILTLELVRQFKRDVESHGGRFYMVNLPTEGDLFWYKAHGSFSYSEIYATLQNIVTVIKPESPMLQVIKENQSNSLFGDGHYGRELQAAVGKEVASRIMALEGDALKMGQPAAKRD
ncbi:MAG: hypothetical protein WCH43_12970 [Verrucomicrobiota bacterium]